MQLPSLQIFHDKIKLARIIDTPTSDSPKPKEGDGKPKKAKKEKKDREVKASVANMLNQVDTKVKKKEKKEEKPAAKKKAAELEEAQDVKKVMLLKRGQPDQENYGLVAPLAAKPKTAAEPAKSVVEVALDMIPGEFMSSFSSFLPPSSFCFHCQKVGKDGVGQAARETVLRGSAHGANLLCR